MYHDMSILYRAFLSLSISLSRSASGGGGICGKPGVGIEDPGQLANGIPGIGGNIGGIPGVDIGGGGNIPVGGKGHEDGISPCTGLCLGLAPVGGCHSMFELSARLSLSESLPLRDITEVLGVPLPLAIPEGN